MANSRIALNANTARIPIWPAAIPDTSIADNCASEVSAAAAAFTRPRNSGGVSPCNITAAATTTTAAPRPMPADPINDVTCVGRNAINKIDAPTPAMPSPINFRESRRPNSAEVRRAEPARVPAAISAPIIASRGGPQCKTSRTYTEASAPKHPAAKVPAAIENTTKENRGSAIRKANPARRSGKTARGGDESAGLVKRKVASNKADPKKVTLSAA